MSKFTKFKIVQKKVRKRKGKTVYDDSVELGLSSKPNPFKAYVAYVPPGYSLKLQGLGLSCHFCEAKLIYSFPQDGVARCREHRNELTPSPSPSPVLTADTSLAHLKGSAHYIYSISRDFAGSVDTARLHTEIQHSLSAPLVTITTNGDHLYIIFGRTLSPHEKTTLDGDFSVPGHPVENQGLPARGLIETHRVSNLAGRGIGESIPETQFRSIPCVWDNNCGCGGGLIGVTGMYGTTGMGSPYPGYTGAVSLPPVEKKEPERQSFIYASDPVMIAAGGVCTTTITIQRDADFYCDEIRVISTGPCSIMIRDNVQNRDWFNKSMPSGLMKGGLKLTIPRRITNTSYLYLELTDTSLAANDVRISLHGYNEFPPKT